ncbi:dTDP-4-dehydrorhamnose reductase [Shewanella sp. 125m-7]
MRILITGAGGQLAQALLSIAELTRINTAKRTAAQKMLLAALPEVVDCIDTKDQLIGLSHQQLDICDPLSICTAFDACMPDVVINCAAYNSVDRAEIDLDKAMAINANGPKFLASECHRRNIRLVHISTDFVFNGELKRPYTEQDSTAPLSVYGKSKREGERWVSEILGSKATIIRTSWLYSDFGQNFVQTMQGLFKVKEMLSVIDDQFGSPTWCEALAVMIFLLIKQKQTSSMKLKLNELNAHAKTPVCNLYHYAGSASCSWFEFATEIQRLTILTTEQTLNNAKCRIEPISTLSWQALHQKPLANRPRQSVLSAEKVCYQLGINPGSLLRATWQEQLNAMIKYQKVKS